MASSEQEKNLLAIYDITGIQEYIFATRWMRENAGASLIVTRMLTKVLPEIIIKVTQGNCATNWREKTEFRTHKEQELLAEIIYIGGGNAVVVYQNNEVYETVNQRFAQALVKQSYTLNLATAAVETTFQDYSADKKKLDAKLKRVKAEMLRQHPLGALPVVEQEAFHGLPITCLDKQGGQVSTLQRLKRQAYGTRGDAVMELIYRETMPSNTAFAVEMKDLIEQEGENAFIAVVHIDGNGMGAMVRDMVEKLKSYATDVPKMREMSTKISQLYQGVFKQLVDAVSLCSNGEETSPGEMERLLPIRPLIMDGDDITFVCKGALGVPLAAMFLRLLANARLDSLQFLMDGQSAASPLSACAGIALVHHNFPFDIAYEIAEECCQNAKKRRKKVDDDGYLDFHLVEGAYVDSLRTLREQENLQAQRRMNRPYRVAKEPNLAAYNSFDRLHQSMKKLHEVNKNGDQKWPRSRLKKLHEAYLQGENALRALREEFASRGYNLEALADVSSDAVGKDQYRAFDALELLELYDEKLFDFFVNNQESEAGQR